MENKKRDRIVNAAMKEFRYGYKRASTETIVREAGISKGLLFHYFGTKENLYEFLVRYAMDVLQKEYFDILNLGQRDILEGIWQQALLKRDISDKYPHIYDFLNGIYTHIEDTPKVEISSLYIEKQKTAMEDMYNHCDTTLFREDVDPKRAVNLIWWAIEGFYVVEETKMAYMDGELVQNYEHFLRELRSYLDTFRLCFYKTSTGE